MPSNPNIPSVRYRSQSGLKSLSPWSIERGTKFLFAEGDARHDRLKLKVEARVHFSPDALEDVLGDISHRDPDSRPDVLRLENRGPDRWNVSTVRDTWLFNAHGTADLAKPGLLVFKLELDLNPTTFLAHQPTPRIADIQARPAAEALRVDPNVRQYLRAVTADGNDNMLLGVDYLGSTVFDHRAERWDALMDTYMGKVQELLAATLVPANRLAVLDAIIFKSIVQAEVHWELEHRDAVSWVSGFRKALFAADNATRFTVYQIGNAECIKLTINPEIALKIYAKEAANRVRFEIEFIGKINRSFRTHSRAGYRTSVPDQLKALRVPAAKHVQRTWNEVMKFTAIEDNATDLCDFMARLNRCVPEENRRVIVSLLANQRRLCETIPDGFAPSTVCQALEREGILIRTRIRKRAPQAQYALAPSWSRMFDRLLNRNDAPPHLMN
ncbi:hypothetical protein [Microvirga makkahensis]|uniref:Uncharacterized protein n=1 Tax=Microvirga makkahensis TaxID=1128670 RepID=A0A7X3SR55_9HYPH|nr:hypothetical protein [Microvirga makkahensis]MXQ13983.1 hypothetical protein [Microvirga makkahensis]